MKKYQIKYGKDCWGCFSFFGYKDGQQYTDAWDNLDELVEQYPQFAKAVQEYRINQVDQATENLRGALKEFIEPWGEEAPELALAITGRAIRELGEQMESGLLDYIKDHQENAANHVAWAMRKFTQEVLEFLTDEQKRYLNL